MIDTLNFRVPTPFQTDYATKMNLNNYLVQQQATGIYFSGSLAKYYHNCPNKLLTRNEIIPALRKLEAETGIELKKALITRVDFAIDLEMTHPATHYLCCFLSAKGSPKREKWGKKTSESSYFQISRNEHFLIYDKTAELLKKSKRPLLQNKNILRIEHCHCANTKKVFDSFLLPFELSTKEKYTQLITAFQNFYTKIELKTETNSVPIEKLNQIEALIFLAQKNSPDIYYELEVLRNTGNIDDPTYYRLKNKFTTNINKTELCSLSKELDIKIKNAIRKEFK